MRNGTKHKMMPLLSPFTTCVLSRLFCQIKWQTCRSRDCSGLFLYPDRTTWGLTGQLIPIPYPIYIEKKYRIWNKNYPDSSNPTNYEENSLWSLTLVASHDMPQRKADVLFYTVKKNPGPHGDSHLWPLFPR